MLKPLHMITIETGTGFIIRHIKISFIILKIKTINFFNIYQITLTP